MITSLPTSFRASLHNVLCSELVAVRLRAKTIIANLDAIGDRGAMLSSAVPFRRGQPVCIEGTSSRFPACVLDCRRKGTLGYEITLEFPKQFQWNKGLFTPEHMLDLKELFGEEAPSTTTLPVRAFSAQAGC